MIVVMDYFTKWVEAKSLISIIKANTCIFVRKDTAVPNSIYQIMLHNSKGRNSVQCVKIWKFVDVFSLHIIPKLMDKWRP